jgi:hypothetical protein
MKSVENLYLEAIFSDIRHVVQKVNRSGHMQKFKELSKNVGYTKQRVGILKNYGGFESLSRLCKDMGMRIRPQILSSKR